MGIAANLLQGVSGAVEREVGARIERLVSPQFTATPRPLAVAWPGGRMGPGDAPVTLRFKEARGLAALAAGNLGDVAEAFVRGELEFDGTMRDLMAAAASLLSDPTHARAPALWQRWWSNWMSRRHHTRASDSRQIQFHYDISDEFYALWLDERRVYSCAYWPQGVHTLAEAQAAKLDLICRKLRLQAGMRFLDIGAGWGGLLLWAAERYGVTAHGVTLSKHQHTHVSRLIAERDLSGRVRMELLDYRDIADTDWGREPFDAIASVGMFEHVGNAQLPAYFSTLRRLLVPGGLVLNHGITAAGLYNRQLSAGMGDFVERHIFPGGELVHASRAAHAAAEGGLEMLDLENLRPHYARTLWAWSDRLEARLLEASRLVPAATLRAYRLYLSGCAMNFEHGWLSLHQLLAAHPDGTIADVHGHGVRGAQSAYPFDRGYMYRH